METATGWTQVNVHFTRRLNIDLKLSPCFQEKPWSSKVFHLSSHKFTAGKGKARGVTDFSQAPVTSEDQMFYWPWQQKKKKKIINFSQLHGLKHQQEGITLNQNDLCLFNSKAHILPDTLDLNLYVMSCRQNIFFLIRECFQDIEHDDPYSIKYCRSHMQLREPGPDSSSLRLNLIICLPTMEHSLSRKFSQM